MEDITVHLSMFQQDWKQVKKNPACKYQQAIIWDDFVLLESFFRKNFYKNPNTDLRLRMYGK